MPSIGVDTPALRGVAAGLSGLGDQLSAMRRGLDRAEVAGFTADSPEFGSTFAGFAGAWSQCLMLMGVGMARLGEAATGAASAYEETDQTAMPTAPSGE